VKARELAELGIPRGDGVRLAGEAIRQAKRAGIEKNQIPAILRDLVASPETYREHPVFGPLAVHVAESAEPIVPFVPRETPAPYQVWGSALDAELTQYPGKTSALLGLKSGVRLDRFGFFGKARAGMWHFNRAYFAADLGGVLEYYPSPHAAVRVDIGDTILFYGGTALGTVHNFQPGIGMSYRF